MGTPFPPKSPPCFPQRPACLSLFRPRRTVFACPFCEGRHHEDFGVREAAGHPGRCVRSHCSHDGPEYQQGVEAGAGPRSPHIAAAGCPQHATGCSQALAAAAPACTAFVDAMLSA